MPAPRTGRRATPPTPRSTTRTGAGGSAPYLLDYLLILPGWLLALFGLVLATPSGGTRSRAASGGSSVGVVLVLVGYALMLGLTIWNRYIRARRTGQSWGKKVVGIHLVRESDLRPIGAGMAVRPRYHPHRRRVLLPGVPLAVVGPEAADLRRQDLLDGGPGPLTDRVSRLGGEV